MTRQGDLSHYNSCNVLSLHALLGAYSDEGAQWLDELRPVLADNIRYACDFIAAHFPGVQVMQPQGTYMLFLDCAAWLQEHHMTLRELEERGARAGVIWQDGAAFAWPDSIRMNLALPHSRLVEAMERWRASSARMVCSSMRSSRRPPVQSRGLSCCWPSPAAARRPYS